MNNDFPDDWELIDDLDTGEKVWWVDNNLRGYKEFMFGPDSKLPEHKEPGVFARNRAFIIMSVIISLAALALWGLLTMYAGVLL